MFLIFRTCEGIKFDIPEIQLQFHEKLHKCEKITNELKECPEIRYINPNQPYYNRIKDYINMPSIGQFEAQNFYCTLFHEITVRGTRKAQS